MAVQIKALGPSGRSASNPTDASEISQRYCCFPGVPYWVGLA